MDENPVFMHVVSAEMTFVTGVIQARIRARKQDYRKVCLRTAKVVLCSSGRRLVGLMRELIGRCYYEDDQLVAQRKWLRSHLFVRCGSISARSGADLLLVVRGDEGSLGRPHVD